MKKPNIKADIDKLSKTLKEVGMNPALALMAERRMIDALQRKDLVSYGAELQYWYGRIDEHVYRNGDYS